MCGATIPFRHFLAEIALAVAAAYLYLHFPLPDAFARFVFCAALFIVALIDYDWRLIPNIITFPGIPIGLAGGDLHDSRGRSQAIAARYCPRMGISISHRRSLFPAAQSRRRRHGRRMAAWNGRRFHGMAGRGIHAFHRLDFGIDRRDHLLRSRAPLPRRRWRKMRPVRGETETSVLRTEVPFGPFLALAAGVFALFQPQIKRWYLGH